MVSSKLPKNEQKVTILSKGGSVEESLVYKFSPYNKFEFSYLRTESQNFVLFFVRKTTEFLTAKHWLR